MGQWLDAVRAATREQIERPDQAPADLQEPVQLVQKVQLMPENPINCTNCTNCIGGNKKKTSDGNTIPEQWTDGFLKLKSMPCPDTIPAPRWQQLIQDATTFMSCWSGKAHALGWSTIEMFGVHPLAPVHRPGSAGLVWLLNGHKVVAITTDKVKIRTPSGNLLTYMRGITDAVPVWS